MRFLCRVGFHDWGNWRAGGTTDHFDEFSTKYPYKTTRRYYRACNSCGWVSMKRQKI